MRIRRIFARLFLLFACAASGPSTAAEPRETVDAATVNRILHLNNIAICLDCPALMITDPDQIGKPPSDGEKLKGPPVADAETIGILEAQERATRATAQHIYALSVAGAKEGHAVYLADCARRLCLAKARVAWARGDAATTVDWLEQAATWSCQALESFDENYGGEFYSHRLDDMLAASNVMAITEQTAYTVRQSCEALGFDLRMIGKASKLDDDGSDTPWLHREIEIVGPTLPPSLPINVATRIDAQSLRHYLRVCQASAFLGLPVAGALDIDELVKTGARDVARYHAETLQVLEQRLQFARRSYRDVKRRSDAGETGVEHRSLAAHRMCQAHATLAWARGDASTALLWLERAKHWSGTMLEAMHAAYDRNYITYELLLDAQAADANTKLAARGVRRLSEELGYDRNPDSNPSDFAVPHRRTGSATTPTPATMTATETADLRRLLHLSSVAGCLDLPPLFGLYDRSLAATRSRNGPIAADATSIDTLLMSSDVANSSFCRTHALYVVDAMGGELEKQARFATDLCLARARLAWATGHGAMTIAWLDLALHWSGIAVEATETSFRSNTITLETCIAVQEVQAKIRLAAQYVRKSCKSLEYDLTLQQKLPSLPDDAMMDTYRVYTDKLRDEFKLPQRDPYRTPRTRFIPAASTDTDTSKRDDDR